MEAAGCFVGLPTTPDISPVPWDDAVALQICKETFGYSSFRTGQLTAIKALLEGKDANVVMATGSGKSLVYQFLPVYIARQTGQKCTCITISPLISLMDDQVHSLTRRGISACTLNSTGLGGDVRAAMKGEYSVIFITPEFAAARHDMLRDMAAKVRMAAIAVDESHCVSEWGHDFRPDYRRLAELRSVLPGVPMVALTATATPRVKKEIMENLQLLRPVCVETTFNRPNLHFAVVAKTSVDQDMKEVARVAGKDSCIVYCLTRSAAEQCASALKRYGVSAGAYHGGLPDDVRRHVHQQFVNDRVQCVAATIAFGMGIDKPDIRLVVHHGLTKSMEAYQQHCGRAARDNAPGRCIMFSSPSDVSNLIGIDDSTGTHAMAVMEMLKHMKNYTQLTTCRRKALLEYFGETLTTPCTGCDNCDKAAAAGAGGPSTLQDFTEYFRLMATCVLEVSPAAFHYGLNMYVDVLRGSQKSKVMDKLKHRLKDIKSYGKGNTKSEKWWKAIGNFMLSTGYLESIIKETGAVRSHGRRASFVVVKLTPKGHALATKPDELVPHMEPPRDLVAAMPPRMVANFGGAGASSGTGWLKARPAALTPDEQAVVEKVTEFRRRLASRDNVAPFLVLPTTALDMLCRYRPTSVEKFKDLEGVTELIATKYGTAFTNYINRLCDAFKLEKNKALPAAETALPAMSDVVPAVPTATTTKQTSYDMFMGGQTVASIATSRSLAESTVLSHMADMITLGNAVDFSKLGLDTFTVDYARENIEAKLRKSGSKRPAQVFTKGVVLDVNKKLGTESRNLFGVVKVVQAAMERGLLPWFGPGAAGTPAVPARASPWSSPVAKATSPSPAKPLRASPWSPTTSKAAAPSATAPTPPTPPQPSDPFHFSVIANAFQRGFDDAVARAGLPSGVAPSDGVLMAVGAAGAAAAAAITSPQYVAPPVAPVPQPAPRHAAKRRLPLGMGSHGGLKMHRTGTQ